MEVLTLRLISTNRCGLRSRRGRFVMIFRAIAKWLDEICSIAGTSTGLTAISDRECLLRVYSVEKIRLGTGTALGRCCHKTSAIFGGTSR